MCNVIKLQNSNKKINVKVGLEADVLNSTFESEEEILLKKMQKEFERGYNTAVEELENKYKNEFEDAITNEKELFSERLKKIDEELKKYEEKFSEMVISVALIISKKIVKHEIEEQSPLIENLANMSQKLIGANYLLIKCNPEEMEALKSKSSELFIEGNFAKIKFEEDSTIEKGGFVIESDIGNIDGKISSQLGEIKKGIENLKIDPRE